jgi:8-oxo-dGTP pyrophosphatase MutT (NUDIX family)
LTRIGRSRKVTAFITRGRGAGAQLLVFRHGASGVQVPAGTVEEGESFQDAALREAGEETGLTGPFVVNRLGRRTYELGEARGVLRQSTDLLWRPGGEALGQRWRLQRGLNVRVVDHANGFARVVNEQIRDLEDDSEDAIVYVRLEGWIPSDLLLHRQVREFFHLELTSDADDR